MRGLDASRRTFLATVGSAGLVSIAGCSGGGDGDGGTPTDSPTPTPSPTPTTPNQEAVEHYQAAIDTLIETKETLDDWAENNVNNMEAVEELQDEVASAHDDLDAAEAAADPGGELSAQIQQARKVADFQELSLAFYEGVLVLLKKFQEGDNFAQNEKHQRAAEAFADAREVAGDIQSAIDDMETVLDELDTDTLDEPALEYTGEPFDYLDGESRTEVSGQVSGFASYVKGRQYVHRAFVQLGEGQRFMDAEEFDRGRETWETGRSHIETAKSAFNAAIDNDHTPKEQRDASFGFLKICNGLLDAFDKLVAGAKEAEDGNLETAEDLIDEGYAMIGEAFEE